MVRSISRCHFALRKMTPVLNSADFVLLTEALYASNVVTKEVVEEVLAEKTADYRSWKLTGALRKNVPRTFDLLCEVLREIGLKEASEHLLQLYEEALTSLPNVCTERYEAALRRAGVPNLPLIVISRLESAIEIRDALMISNSTQRIVLIFGMGGYGKTTLLLQAIRNEEVIDHFSDGIAWCSVGPNVSVEQVFLLIKRLIGNTDTEKLLIVIDDVWGDEMVPAVAQKFKMARIAVTSRFLSCLGETRDQCGLMHKANDGFSFDECRLVFAKRLQMAEEELPVVAIDAVCFACSSWPLGITSVAQLVVEGVEDDGRLIEECLNDYLILLRKKDYKSMRVNWTYAIGGQLMEKFDSEVDLHFALYLSVSHLKAPQLERLECLAVLDPNVWVSAQALQTIWAHLGSHDVLAVASLLPGILTTTSNRRCTSAVNQPSEELQLLFKLHDVMHTVVKSDSTEEAICAINEQLIMNYERLCGGEWGQVSDDGYIITHLLDHLEKAGRSSKIPDVFGDFFFVSKLFGSSGWAATLESVRRFTALFVTPEQQKFRDDLTEALEEIACTGTNPLYEVSLLQLLLQLPYDHPMYGWAEKAMICHPEAADPAGIGVWISACRSHPVTHSKKRLPLPRKTRGTVAKDRSHYDVICVALNISKQLLVAVGYDNSLTVCDAHSLVCKSSGMQLLLEEFVLQVAVTNRDRTLLLLTERQELFCAHLRSCLQELPRNCAIDGNKETIRVLRILSNISVQRFALQGDLMALMDNHYILMVMDLKFAPLKNVVPDITKVTASTSRISCENKSKERNSALQIIEMTTRILANVQLTSNQDIGDASIIGTAFPQLLGNVFEITSILMALLLDEPSEEVMVMLQMLPPESLSIRALKNGIQSLISSLNSILVGINQYKCLPTFFQRIWCDLNQLNDLAMTLKEPNLELSPCGIFLAVKSSEDIHKVSVFKTADIESSPLTLQLPSAVTALQFVEVDDAASVHLAVAYGKMIGIWSVQEKHICQQLEHQHNVLMFASDPQHQLCAAFEFPVLTLWHLSPVADTGPFMTVDLQSITFEDSWFAQQLSFIHQKRLGHLQTQAQPLISRMLSFYHLSPAVVTVGDRMFLVSNVAEEALFIIDPHTRCVLFSDIDNKIKSRVIASSSEGIAVGGLAGALCEYHCSTDGHFSKALMPPVGDSLQFARITALEYTVRNSLIIGLENGAIWCKTGEQELHQLKDANGKFVYFLVVLKQKSGFISLATDSSDVELSVWKETEQSVFWERTFVFPCVASSDLQIITKESYSHSSFKFSPKVSNNETYVAVAMTVMAKHIIVANIEKGTSCEVNLNDMVCTISSLLFHPLNDRILFLSCGASIICLRLEENDDHSMHYTNSIVSFNENIFHISVLDTKHLIVTSDESVTAWNVSPGGQLSPSTMILSVAKVEGRLHKTFAFAQTMLILTTGFESMVFRIYPLKRFAKLNNAFTPS